MRWWWFHQQLILLFVKLLQIIEDKSAEKSGFKSKGNGQVTFNIPNKIHKLQNHWHKDDVGGEGSTYLISKTEFQAKKMDKGVCFDFGPDLAGRWL